MVVSHSLAGVLGVAMPGRDAKFEEVRPYITLSAPRVQVSLEKVAWLM